MQTIGTVQSVGIILGAIGPSHILLIHLTAVLVTFGSSRQHNKGKYSQILSCSFRINIRKKKICQETCATQKLVTQKGDEISILGGIHDLPGKARADPI